jgi:hypothetical protein
MDILVCDQPPGVRFTLVAKVIETADGVLRCCGISPEQTFVVCGAPVTKPGLYTFYDLQRMEQDGACQVIEGLTEIHGHPPLISFSGVNVFDFCSGMGGFSIGSQLLGMRTTVFVEQNHLACEALRANFTSPVFESDLGNIDTLKRIHALKGPGFNQATGGFPCRGFSRQGDQLGMDDHRSHSLCAILQASWFLQMDAMLLECVDNVINFPQAQECIDQHALHAGMHIYKMTFDLQDQWPVRRSRFWCHLIRKDLPKLTIPRWPKSSCFRVLGDIMPLEAIWSEIHEQQLEWDPSELAIYLDPSFGSDQRLLQTNEKAPTVLHSWGHVNRDCPCGCRSAFSLARLRKGGARGFGLISSCTGKYRHLHPEEGAVLCTVPPTFQFPMNPRAALSLLGQIAAPLQVLWIQTHVLASLQLHFWGQTGLDPIQIIKVYQQQLKAHAFTRWITPSMYQPRAIQVQYDDDPTIYVIKIEAPTTVQDLAHAEKRLLGWGQYAVVTHADQRLHPEVQLFPGLIYKISHRTCKHIKPIGTMPQLVGGGQRHESLFLGDRLLWTFMQALAQHHKEVHNADEIFILPPFQALPFLDRALPLSVASSWATRWQKTLGHIFLTCELHGHWTLVHGFWNPHDQGLEWTLHDGLNMQQTMPWMRQVTKKFSYALRTQFLGIRPGLSHPQTHGFTCGTLALVHMAQQLHLLHQVADEQVAALHDWLYLQQDATIGIFAGGPDECQQQLIQLLQEKGVHSNSSADRAKLIINKIGIRQVQTIMKSKHPWADLKAAASKPGMMFRLITMDEQKQYIAERAKTKHGAKVSNHRAKKSQKSGHQNAVQLDPHLFILNANHFKDDDDLPVGQIDFAEVQAEARGVALCNVDMARHFLSEPSSISTAALALLLVDSPEAEIIQTAGLQRIIIPAKFKGTDEDTLIYGFIMQLGDSTVHRELASKDSSPDVIDTKVVKIQIYRDQLAMEWNRFAEAPIRALVHATDALQLCKGANYGTGCGKFHPGLDESIDNVIFEIWARSFLDEQGRKTSIDQAILFTVFMRIPEGALAKLLSYTPCGVYVEPRGSQPGEQDTQFRVVWLPGVSAEEAAHQCRTCDKAISLVRLKSKYGIRTRKEDEQAAWAHLRPGVDFMALDIQLIYELSPIPHGTQRQSIAKLLSDWGWQARPLQPGKGSYHHMAWRVGAQKPPPQTVMTGFQNDIVITQVKELKQQPPSSSWSPPTRLSDTSVRHPLHQPAHGRHKIPGWKAAKTLGRMGARSQWHHKVKANRDLWNCTTN